MTGVESTTVQTNFKLTFENKVIFGEITYVPFHDNSILGGYKMRFYNESFRLESNIVRNFAFRRMKKSLFMDLLERKGIHEIFLELH